MGLLNVTPRNRSVHRGYSLNTLFLLMAACAVVVGMVTPILRRQVRVGGEELLGSALVGGLVMLAIGWFIGVFHYSKGNGIGWGLIVGGLLGMICGPIMFIPPERFPFIFLTSIGGSVLILGLAFAIRMSHSIRPPETPPETPEQTEPVQATVVKPKRHPLDPDPDEDEV
jgi:hypothetical protein